MQLTIVSIYKYIGMGAIVKQDHPDGAIAGSPVEQEQPDQEEMLQLRCASCSMTEGKRALRCRVFVGALTPNPAL
jgi:hypothetical protein